MRNYIVVGGVGRVGYRIVRQLLAEKEQVVAIEKDGVSVVLHKKGAGGAALPDPESRIQGGDTIVVASVVASPIDRMHLLEEANRG